MIDVDWFSAIVSFAALLGSGGAFLIARKSRLRAEKFEELGAKIAVLQNQLAHRSWADEFFRDVTSWATNASHAIARAIHWIDTSDPEKMNDVMIDLSASIDTGRWYFPNRHEDKYGAHKQPAYRGFRQPILESIVHAYRIVENPTQHIDPRGELIVCQRQFVSCMQEFLDPRTREQVILRVLSDFRDVAVPPKGLGN